MLTNFLQRHWVVFNHETSINTLKTCHQYADRTVNTDKRLSLTKYSKLWIDPQLDNKRSKIPNIFSLRDWLVWQWTTRAARISRQRKANLIWSKMGRDCSSKRVETTRIHQDHTPHHSKIFYNKNFWKNYICPSHGENNNLKQVASPDHEQKLAKFIPLHLCIGHLSLQTQHPYSSLQLQVHSVLHWPKHPHIEACQAL